MRKWLKPVVSCLLLHVSTIQLHYRYSRCWPQTLARNYKFQGRRIPLLLAHISILQASGISAAGALGIFLFRLCFVLEAAFCSQDKAKTEPCPCRVAKWSCTASCSRWSRMVTMQTASRSCGEASVGTAWLGGLCGSPELVVLS